MQCPHCTVNIHENFDTQFLSGPDLYGGIHRQFITAGILFCPRCGQPTVALEFSGKNTVAGEPVDRMIVHPQTAAIESAPMEVSEHIRKHYTEACVVLPASPKASAALSRRILQTILVKQGYEGRNLATQVDNLLNEANPAKVLP